MIRRIEEMMDGLVLGSTTLQTWTEGIQKIGVVRDFTFSGNDIVVARTSVEEETRVDGPMIWISTADDLVRIPTGAKVHNDTLDLGRVMTTLEDGSLATFFPPGLDPKQPLPKSAAA